MMSRLKRVLKHAVTGYIPQGTLNDIPPPLLNQIKEEPKPEVTEPLKQEESQELSKLPDEEQPDCSEISTGLIPLRLLARSSAGARAPRMSGVSSRRTHRIAFDEALAW